MFTGLFYYPQAQIVHGLADVKCGFEYVEFMIYVLGIATAEGYPTTFAAYMQKSTDAKAQFFKTWGEIRWFNDMDVALTVINAES